MEYLKGLCTVWVGFEKPPRYAKNIVWLKMDKNDNFENLFIRIDDEWYPIGVDDDSNNAYQTLSSQYIRHLLESARIHIGDDPPTEPAQIWIRPSYNEFHYRLENGYRKMIKIVNEIDYRPSSDSMTQIPTVYALLLALDKKIDWEVVNDPNGVAGLDDYGIIGIAHIPDSIKGCMKCQGHWNAETNVPDLTTVAPDGHFYIVNKSGTFANQKYNETDIILSYIGSWLRIKVYPEEALNTKVDKVEGKQLSTNDYTNVEKEKLQGIEAMALVNKNEIEVDYTATEHDPIVNWTVDQELKAGSRNPISNNAVYVALKNLPKHVTLTEEEYNKIIPDTNTYYYIIEE